MIFNLSDPQQFYVQVGERIKGARTLAVINQETLATELGITRASIINLEKGRHRPSLFMLMEIAKVLMCDYTSLIPVESKEEREVKKMVIDFSTSITSDPLTKSGQASIKKAVQGKK